MSYYDTLVNGLIELNKNNRSLYVKQQKSISLFQYLYEFCVVSVDIGRAVGKTSFIRNNATEKDLVIVKDRGILGLYSESKFTAINSEYMKWHDSILRNIDFEKIYIDEPYLALRNINLFNVIQEFGKNYDQTFILLGK